MNLKNISLISTLCLLAVQITSLVLSTSAERDYLTLVVECLLIILHVSLIYQLLKNNQKLINLFIAFEISIYLILVLINTINAITVNKVENWIRFVVILVVMFIFLIPLYMFRENNLKKKFKDKYGINESEENLDLSGVARNESNDSI
ncbi:hypothetical protein HDU92_000188 [Lobulomyces angularis]|nr:hypothetical protein HDU92_000188 [Lobulomyces angularis]